MINGTAKTESSYRKLQYDSSSSLKDFSFDKRRYHRKYILGETIEDKETQAINTGRVVETLLFEPELFDEKFSMSACVGTPSGLMNEFVEALYTYTKEATDDEGNISRTFEDISRDAYVKSGFKLPYDTIIKKFVGSDAEIYYNEIRIVRSKGLTVVTAQDVTNAEKIVEELKTNFVTKDIVNLVDSDRWSVLKQFQIENYEADGHYFKSMIDLCIVDHEEKSINVYDLKCTWSVENFYEEYYLYRRAYIQALLYFHAVSTLVKDEKHEYYEYHVHPTKFIVCDSINYYNPLIYSLSTEDLKDAYEGFEHKGRKYPGVKNLILDLRWANDNDIWNISRENYINNGVVNIKE